MQQERKTEFATTQQNSTQALDLAAIGNGRVAALINASGKLLWWCFPRFDSDPVFSNLLSGSEDKGFLDVTLIDGVVEATSAYIRNTAILETVLRDSKGNAIKITDFAPRFTLYERLYHPSQLIRRIEPIAGLPRIKIRLRPTRDYGQPRVVKAVGSNHVTYPGGLHDVRLTTDAPLSYVLEESTFALARPLTLILGPDEPLQAAVDTVARESLERTRDYWLGWVRGLAVPLEWQQEVIRAAVTLKLCNFDETGAIVAALTTSIPEAPGTQRNWDYRFCWLRDAYFVVKALNRLGATHTMEHYLDYITTVATDQDQALRPVYGIVHSDSLEETIAQDLAGFQGMGPVRVGNQAAEQLQHDAYGSIILAVSQMFIDQRLPRMGDISLFHRLEVLGHRARRSYLEPDAGIWEYRGRQHIHTHSATMCWVALDRLARIAGQLGLRDRFDFWRSEADKAKHEILSRAWSDKRGAIVGALDGTELDASVLLLPELGLLSANDERFIKTCDVIGKELNRGGNIMRYVAEDDFGEPETGFLVCQFWYIDALAAIGRTEEARGWLTDLLDRRNSFGLLSEDIHPASGHLWGNIPQTYSMAGIVNSCMTLSRPWEDAWMETPLS